MAKGMQKMIIAGPIAQVVELLGDDVFNTRDVSDHPTMADHHGDLVHHSQFRAMVGKALKRLTDSDGHLMLDEKPRTSRGSMWQRVRLPGSQNAHPQASQKPHPQASQKSHPQASQKPHPQASQKPHPQASQKSHPQASQKPHPQASQKPHPQASQNARSSADIGPQYDKDNVFTAKMRRHQSWYRAEILGLPYGVGPNASGQPLGNMLTGADGQRGANYLSADIFDEVRSRMAQGGGVSKYRALHNMLSSQPMCFNIFGPMVNNLEMATRLFGAVFDDLASVTRVLIEYAPQPAAEYLDDHTSFDAFVEYVRHDGELAFVGIETKLTEPFSQKEYDKPTYRRWMASGAWKASATGQVALIAHNQLWRDHLLAVATLNHPDSPYASGKLALVRHPGDKECARVVKGYEALLNPHDETYIDLPLSTLTDAFRGVVTTDEKKWLDAFVLRYLALD